MAPANGRVVAVRRDLPDYLPLHFHGFPLAAEKSDRMLSWGNYITIDHGHSEYFVLAHCRQGSITVKPWDTVRRGQAIREGG
ncbi:MAG TPA: M23 family metallopeptidase [bacterium]|nr:M23 family metallopeptidase [bacterium]